MINTSIENATETIIALAWVSLAWIDVSFSFISGAMIFYFIQIDRGKRVFSPLYFLLLVGVSAIGGHYTFDLLPYIVIEKYQEAITPINFIIGLVSKLILDIALTKEFVEGKIND